MTDPRRPSPTDRERPALPPVADRYLGEVSRLEPPEDLYRAVLRDVAVTPQRRRRRLVRLPEWALAGVVVLILAVTGGAWLTGRTELPGTVASPTPSRAPSPDPSSPAAEPSVVPLPDPESLPVAGSVQRRFPGIEGVPAAFGHGSLWLTDELSGEVTRFDPETGEVQARIQFEAVDNPYSPTVTVTADSVWVNLSSDGTIHRIDAATNEVAQTLDVNLTPFSIVPDGDDLWLSDYNAGVVARVDAQTGEEIARVVLLTKVSSLVIVGDSVWVGRPDDAAIARIDRTTNQLVTQYPLVREASHMLVDGDRIWAFGVDMQGTDLFDTTTQRVVARTVGMVSVVTLAGRYWGAPAPDTIVELDPETLEARARIPIADASIGEMVAGDGRLWVIATADEQPVLLEVVPSGP